MGAVAPFSAIEPYIIGSESSGQNVMQNLVPQNVSTASGYFQITNSTWKGVPSSITQGYPTAMSAPFSVQEQAANYLWNTNSGSDWLGNPSAGYAGNSQIQAANNAILAGQTPTTPYFDPAQLGGGVNPVNDNSSLLSPLTDQQNLENYGYFGTPTATGALGGVPDTSIAGLTGTDGSNASNYNYFGLPVYDPNATTGTAPVTVSGGATNFWNEIFAGLGDFFVRGGLVVGGLVLLALAVWAMLRNPGLRRKFAL